MKKNSIFAASYLGVASVWLGGHFGPGFATGAFSVNYYVKYGWIGLFGPLLAMLITGGVIFYMTEYARAHGTTNYRPFVLSCYGDTVGPVFAVIYDVLFLATVMCAGGLAFSGEANVLMNFGFSYWGAAIPTIIISALLCLYGSKLLSLASKYMMYAIVAVVLLIAVLSLAFGPHDIPAAFAAAPVNQEEPNLLRAVLSAILYGCFQSTIAFNVMSVADILESREETKKAIIAGYIITVALMIAIAFTLFCYVTVIPDICNPGVVAVPIMAVLGRLGMPWLTYLFVLLMTLAVLTSAAGLANAGCRRFDKLFSFIGNLQLRRTVITVILLGVAAIGASFGMKALLQQGTSIVGYIGIPVLVIPAFCWVRTKLDK
ncbi:MAG: hypothetical protein K5746_03460 [Clostridiales bacterium]|nr:hypothetical protein [Clostridiales bacterium]